MPLLSGATQVQPAPQLGDKVVITWGRDHDERELTGWVLNITADQIRIADNSVDDGRPNADEDWFRRTFLLSDVSVLVLPSPTSAALAHTERSRNA